MTRTLSTATRDEFTAPEFAPVAFTEFTFPSGPIRLWNGIGDIEWDSVTWTGAGDLLSVGIIEETSGLAAKGLEFQLSGVPAEIISLAVNEEYQGGAVQVYLGAISETRVVTVDPVSVFQGFMDVMEFTDEGETAAVRLSAENRLIALERSSPAFYTPESQKLFFPADKGYNFVAALQELEIVWGT